MGKRDKADPSVGDCHQVQVLIVTVQGRSRGLRNMISLHFNGFRAQTGYFPIWRAVRTKPPAHMICKKKTSNSRETGERLSPVFWVETPWRIVLQAVLSCLLGTRLCSKHVFALIRMFIHVLFITTPFYRLGNRGAQRGSNLPKATQPIGSGADLKQTIWLWGHLPKLCAPSLPFVGRGSMNSALHSAVPSRCALGGVTLPLPWGPSSFFVFN